MMDHDDSFEGILGKIEELLEDELITKNVKGKLHNIKELLEKADTVDSVTVEKALDEVEDVNEDPNIPSFIREDILNVTSMLSALK
ncbi:MAG: UPF0147 family protein [Candidatus Woesearchaeota archaeon]|jgi:uncharacterized protein (UPF0147 family)|nr:UPF0147 family protein [Candidatus Woesearchaeota archaeon]MDP7323541.1 UPF0147 family protein [Candidatus Woesearchaeota archaeon]|tara:strand:+ start:174 stop:431 length:258 start_codon:yes stop_codon:yes gene_type:complete